MTVEGNRATRIVSLSRSSAHMPRVILRTVDPAKLLACQSVENRWTRWNASAAMSGIIFSVRSMMPMKATCRSTMAPTASTTRAENAADRGVPVRRIAAPPAGDRIDEPARIERRQHVGQRREQHGRHDDGQAPGLMAPVAESEAKNAAESAAAQIDAKTSHDDMSASAQTPSSESKSVKCRDETDVGNMRSRCERSLNDQAAGSGRSEHPGGEPRETMSNTGIQTSLAWVAEGAYNQMPVPRQSRHGQKSTGRPARQSCNSAAPARQRPGCCADPTAPKREPASRAQRLSQAERAVIHCAGAKLYTTRNPRWSGRARCASSANWACAAAPVPSCIDRTGPRSSSCR